jgi:transcriptional antiterminator RfaH
MTAQWYALHTKTLKEGQAAQQLEAQAIPVFYPRLHVTPVNPRSRTVRPFFPGYIFVRADLVQLGLSMFQYLPGAIGLVCFGDEPAVIAVDLLQAIEAQLEAINAAGGEPFLKLHRGDSVVITHGPFAGYEAIFDGRLRDGERVRVFLDLLGRHQVALDLAVNQIRLK